MTITTLAQPTATPQVQDDPFTLLIKGIWEVMIEGHPPLVDMVKPGNMVKRFVGDRPGKPKVQDGDVPELDVIPVGTTDQMLYMSSHGAAVMKAFDIAVTTGDKNVEKMFSLEWELIRAISKVTLNAAATGKEADFGYAWVKKIDIVTQSESLTDFILNRKRQGWTSLMTIVFHLNFDRQTQLLADVPTLRSNPSED